MVSPRTKITEFPARPVSHVAGIPVGQALAATLAGLVVLYGALLRFDAVTLRYGPVDRPAWLHALQESRALRSAIRPAAITWDPAPTYPHRDGPRTHYASDPYTYLQRAREMRSFYAAHRREPLFPFVTKIFLLLLHQQDVAVSFASASFSVLAIVATFLLGWYALSYWAGLGAALGMAIEYDVISWGVGGWRDDAFTCAVVLSALAMLRYYRAPSRWAAVLMGVVGGLSCLIRITSLSFLLPGFACLLFTTQRSWRERLGGVGLGTLVATAIVAPFLINCWLAFGDPLYAIDVHVGVYRAAEGQTAQTSEAVPQYLRGQARSRPIGTLDTAVLGMTTYPFLNKWRGFDLWIPGSGKWLSWAAVAGVILFFGFSAGRLLLVVVAASLVPYALTWKLISDWRFTEHAYPFFLIAASFAIGQAVVLASPSRIRTLSHRRPTMKSLVFWGSVLSALAVGGWIVMRVLPVLIVQESLRANEPATITAGDRDASFFVKGWSRPYAEGNVTVRVSEGERAVVRIPLPRVQDYALLVRLDPFPRPPGDSVVALPTVRVFMNGQAVAVQDLRWTPGRVGAYDIYVPRSATKAGLNYVVFFSTPKPGGSAQFRLWYVRVRPLAS